MYQAVRMYSGSCRFFFLNTYNRCFPFFVLTSEMKVKKKNQQMQTFAPPSTKIGIICKSLVSRRNKSNVVPSLNFFTSIPQPLPKQLTPHNYKIQSMLVEYFRLSTLIACSLNTHFVPVLEFNRERQVKLPWTCRAGGVIARFKVMRSDKSHFISRTLNSAFHSMDSSSQGLGEENGRIHLGLQDAINIFPEI